MDYNKQLGINRMVKKIGSFSDEELLRILAFQPQAKPGMYDKMSEITGDEFKAALQKEADKRGLQVAA